MILTMFRPFVVVVLLLVSASGLAVGFPGVGKQAADFPGASDEVTAALPGVGTSLRYKHYSGYLKSIDDSFLYYWLFESQGNVSGDPLLVWLNGGPGASSLLGALTENGPLQFNELGQLRPNAYAWNKRASIVYIESPAEVGFSYNIHHKVRAGDNYTAELNYAALEDFFKKFPQFHENDFYITGESYGGIYVPTLAALVDARRLVSKFKGIAIGNGVLDWDMMDNADAPFANYHGFVDPVHWNEFLESCCPNVTNIAKCDVQQAMQTRSECRHAKSHIHLAGVNPYNIYDKCEHSKSQFAFFDRVRAMNNDDVEGDQQHQSPVSPRDSAPCMNDDTIIEYLNRADVRKVLHIRPETTKWSPVNYTVNTKHVRNYATMKPFFEQLLKSKLRILVYNGDVDSVCNFISNQWFVEDLSLKVSKPYAPWYVGGQVAGLSKTFGPGNQLTFTTIRGSGHMVPTDRPEEAQTMLDMFLDNKF